MPTGCLITLTHSVPSNKILTVDKIKSVRSELYSSLPIRANHINIFVLPARGGEGFPRAFGKVLTVSMGAVLHKLAYEFAPKLLHFSAQIVQAAPTVILHNL